MKFFVTGGAGYIGSHFCDWALSKGHQVLAYDDLSTGTEFFLKDAVKNSSFRLEKGDIRELAHIEKTAASFKADWTIHFAANADVRRGTERPRRDLDYNTIGTWNVLEATRNAGTKNILFSSTGSVYGEPEVFPTPEHAPFPEQTSLYGASKLAGEGLISAYAHGFGIQGVVFRFVSILGPRYTHGHVFDFLRQLKNDPSKLHILGDGLQTKSYLHVEDLMRGLWTVIEKRSEALKKPFEVFNVGHDDALIVKQSVGYITEKFGTKPSLSFGGGSRGWIGDSPRIQLDTTKLRKLGWSTQKTLQQSIYDTVEYLMENSFLLDRVD